MEEMNDSLLKDWIQQEDTSTIPKIQSFCDGILRDLKPLLSLVRYSANNALEGNVNRIKMIKRAMCGHAGYDLLGAKVFNRTF